MRQKDLNFIKGERSSALIRCSAKDYNNRGFFFQKLANAQHGDWFCETCRDQLKALGNFSQE